MICKCNYKAHTAPLCKKCKLLKLKDIVDFNILVVMFKAKHNLLPKIYRICFRLMIIVIVQDSMENLIINI